MIDLAKLKVLLDRKVIEYNTRQFIIRDPICVPHRFSKQQDIEIAAFFAATFAWGNRTTIINKANELLTLMDDSPHDFIVNHQPHELKKLLHFKHRTFNAHDAFYFIEWLSFHYQQHPSLEFAFCHDEASSTKDKLISFHNYFFSQPHQRRTEKHVSTPAKNSACKRLNMFLRWMVRKDNQGVDFGIWNSIKMKDLICPLDVHVGNVAFRLGLLSQHKADWKTAAMLTEQLKVLDPDDPAKYDFALFALGVEEKFR